MSSAKISIHPLSEESKEMAKSQPDENGQLSLDIFQTTREIIILAPIAGVKPEDINLSITDEVLVIRGERKTKHLVHDEDYYTRECFWGPFSRSIVLPLEADTQSISAEFEDNVLEIHIPKKEIAKTRIIKINSNE